MAMKSETYMETMNSPLRPETQVRILITNKDTGGTAPADSEAVSIYFENSDILESDEYQEADEISRSLPVHTLKFSVLDTDRSLQEKYDWEKLRCKALVQYTQHYIPGLPYQLYIDPVNLHAFYVKKVVTSGQITTFYCQDVFWALSNHTLEDSVSHEPLVWTREQIREAIVKYPPHGIRLSWSNIWYGSLQTIQKFYDSSISILLQKLLCPCGFLRALNGTESLEKPSDTWNIQFWYKESNKNPAETDYILNICNVYKDGIQRVTIPPVSEITGIARDVKAEADDTSVTVIPVKYDPDSVYNPDPNTPNIFYDAQTVKFSQPYINIKPYANADKVRFIKVISLYECKVYWNGTWLQRPPEKRPSISLKANLVIQQNNFKKVPVPGVSQGSTEKISNPFLFSAAFDEINFVPYIYRNILKIKYRGDFTLEPGVTNLWFEYAPGEKIPCRVISNRIVIKGSMRGEIKLRILLTDSEIRALSPNNSPLKNVNTTSNESNEISNAEKSTQEVIL